MERYFVLLGENPLLWGQVCHLRELGFKVILVAWSEKPRIKGDLYIQKDIKDAPAVIAELEANGLKGKVDGALSSIDLAVPTVNAINGWCGNKTMPEVFNKVLSKEEMRNAWMKAGVFNRISKMDNELTLAEIYDLSQRMKLICKPDVAASSRGITTLEKGSTEKEIVAAMNVAKEASFNKLCLIEEFVTGREFTVDMLGDDYCNVVVYGISVKYHTPYAGKNRCAVKLHWNSNAYSDEIYKAIALFGRKCYKAIGLKNSFGHLEMIMKEDGTLTPVEIGARTSGFIGSHLVSAASEHDYLHDYVEMLHGKSVGNEDHINGKQSAMWYKYNIPIGCTCLKETSMTDYLDPQITVMYNDHGGLNVGECYGPIVDDNTCDHEGFEMIKGPKDVLTYESIRKSEAAFLKAFCNYNEPLAYED